MLLTRVEITKSNQSFIINLANIFKDYNNTFCHGNNEMGKLSESVYQYNSKTWKIYIPLIQLFHFFTGNYNFQKTVQQSYKILKAKKPKKNKKKDGTIQANLLKKINDDDLF